MVNQIMSQSVVYPPLLAASTVFPSDSFLDEVEFAHRPHLFRLILDRTRKCAVSGTVKSVRL